MVSSWLQTGRFTREVEPPAPRRGPRERARPLQCFITERLGTYPELSAVRLFAEVHAAGYPGGITQLRAHVACIRPRPEL